MSCNESFPNTVAQPKITLGHRWWCAYKLKGLHVSTMLLIW